MNRSIAGLVLVLVLAIGVGLSAGYAEDVNTAPRTLIETVGTTNYVGVALATRNGGTPSINDDVWSIVKIVEEGALVEITHAFNTNAIGNQLTRNAWTNRVNANYR